MLHKLRFIIQQSCNPTWSTLRYCSGLAISETKRISDVLQPVEEDLSEITPNFQKSFNIAAYVNRSETLQNLVNLNVNLNKIEKKPHIVDKILKLDFEKDMQNHILFINDYIGLEAVGEFVTKNPMIFYEDLKDLEVRVNYLISKGFKHTQICRIICKNPYWLMFNTLRIDRRFGYFQEMFELTGNELRYLATKQPRLITYNVHSIKTNTFSIKEEMGFENHEIKAMILNKPRIWMLNHHALLQRFNYLHNTMKIPHNVITENPEVLLSRVFRIKQRHLFLEKLGRAQYDRKKENYVPVTALIKETDLTFCLKYAKCNISDFNLFLKTL